MNVFFDYKDLGSTLLLCVIGKTVTTKERFGKTVLQETKEVRKEEGTNFYHWTLQAFQFAIDLMKDEAEDFVMFKNQQNFIFDWLINKSYKDKYDEDYDIIYEGLYELNSNGIDIRYEVIAKEKNEAKKYLTKLKKRGTMVAKGNLNSIFDNAPQTQQKQVVNGTSLNGLTKAPTKATNKNVGTSNIVPFMFRKK